MKRKKDFKGKCKMEIFLLTFLKPKWKKNKVFVYELGKIFYDSKEEVR